MLARVVIGMKLKRMREANGLSQADLARRAKITREYVNKLEAGRYDPTVGVIQRLAKTFSGSCQAICF